MNERLPLNVALAFIIKQGLAPTVPWEALSPESQAALIKHGDNIIRELPKAGYRIVETILQ